MGYGLENILRHLSFAAGHASSLAEVGNLQFRGRKRKNKV